MLFFFFYIFIQVIIYIICINLILAILKILFIVRENLKETRKIFSFNADPIKLWLIFVLVSLNFPKRFNDYVKL